MADGKILVVDDDEDIHKLFGAALSTKGFVVSSVYNGEAALSAIRKDKPDLMILDLRMPGLSGNEVCRRVKDDPDLQDIIIFILSAKGDLETKIDSLAIGADEYLVKPIDPREVTARVARFLNLVNRLNQPKNLPSSSSQERLEPEKATEKTIDVFAVNKVKVDSGFKKRYGTYVVESLVGSGGMGRVFLGFDEVLERNVAIKVLSPMLSDSQKFVERFRREGKLLASINHPGIASIYSFGEEKGEHYFAMQWYSGGSLADLIRVKGKMGLLPAVNIILQCAQALSAASAKGVVHRDIKPSNLMMDENEQIRIVDFGLAREQRTAPATDLTQGSEVFGTPNYMAPEQALASAVDHRTDIYSLGITFYEIIYGKLPFTAQSQVDMILQHVQRPFPPYDDLGGTIPDTAYRIIQRMTQKDPSERYPDYATLIRDLEQLQDILLQRFQLKIPKPERIEQIPAITGGDIFQLLATVYGQQLSGILNVSCETARKSFLIRRKEVVLFKSSQPEESIWNILVQKNLLKEEERPDIESDLETPLNHFLASNAFLLQDFQMIYRDLMKASLQQVFFRPVVEAQFLGADIEHDAFSKISLGDVLLEAARNLVDYERIKKNFPEDVRLSLVPQSEKILYSLNLKPEESFLASRFEGQFSIGDLCSLTGLTEEKVIRFAYALEKLGILHFQESSKSPPVGRTHFPKTPVDLQKIPSESISNRALPQAPSSGPLNPIEKQAEKPLLESPSILPHSVTPSSFRMETQKSPKMLELENSTKAAEQFYRQAQQAFQKGDYWRVVQLCQQAVARNPGEAKYYHLMATAYSKHPRFLKDAENSFYKAIQLKPDDPDYYVDLAEFFMLKGFPLRALHECKKALEIAPKHQRTLRLLKHLNATK